MNERLEVALLGIPLVRLGGQPVTGFRSSKAEALLYYLAVTRRAHARLALSGMFWGDSTEEQSRRSLRSVLSNLRELVGSHLTITAHEIAFTPIGSYWLDVHAFEADTGHLSTGSDVGQVQRALALYRGDFLEGFYVRDAPEFEQWMLAQRQRLHERAIQTWKLLVNLHEHAGDWQQAIDAARRLLELDPWREEVHRQLMGLLARSGQRSVGAI
jgi:DNA-binding SARP family transcriptional activator